MVTKAGNGFPVETKTTVDEISSNGGTPLVGIRKQCGAGCGRITGYNKNRHPGAF